MKKTLCYLLSAVLLLTALCIPVSAELADTAGYSASNVIEVSLTDIPDILTLKNDSALGFDSAAYYQGTAFKISDAEGLKLLSKITNSSTKFREFDFYDKAVFLANDINMSGVTDFEPIGHGNNTAVGSVPAFPIFSGTFDGQGHSIKNLVMTSNAGGNATVGLFGVIGCAYICNLVIDETCSFSYTGSSVLSRTAAVVAWAHSSPNDSGLYGVDAVTGFATSNMICNVENNANVTSNCYAGGILCSMSATTNYTPYMENCTNNGDIKGMIGAAGIIGYMANRHVTMVNCKNTGDITSTYRAAGLVNNEEQPADVKKVTLQNCYAAGTVKGETIDAIILMGKPESLTMTDCEHSVTLVQEEAAEYFGFTTDPIDYGTEVIGYNPAAVGTKKDLSNVLPICTYMDAPDETTEFKISTPEDLAYFATVVNAGVNFKDCTIYLENDINMNGVTMKPIGSSTSMTYTDSSIDEWKLEKIYAFSGTFDGQGYVIDNLKIDVSFTDEESASNKFTAVGLFGILRSATVKNVVLGSGCSFSSTGKMKAYVGAIVGLLYRLDGGTNVTNCTIENCYSAATVTGPNSVGGIVGLVESNNNIVAGHYIRNCTNAGAISAAEYAGGIVGYIDGRKLNVLNCRNVGKVTLTATEQSNSKGAAGIVARPNSQNDVLIDKCINNGEIAGPGTLGGIIAIENYISVSVLNCTNFGKLTAPVTADNVGPIYGMNTINQYMQFVNNSDQTEGTDPTYTAYTVTTNFPNYAEIEEAHGKLFAEEEDDETGGSEGEGEAQVTTPVTNKPAETQKPAENTKPAEQNTKPADSTTEKKGCGAAFGGAFAILLAVGAAGVMLRKKEN